MDEELRPKTTTFSEDEKTELLVGFPDGSLPDEKDLTSLNTPGRNKVFSTIAMKLEEIRKQKSELKDIVSTAKNAVKGEGKKVDYSKRPKKLFSHPKLEYVYGEIVYSPYMCSPIEHYPKETFTVHKKLQELRAKEVQANCVLEGEEPVDLSLPYDVRKTKNAFIKIVNYKAKYGKCKDKVAGYVSNIGVAATSRIIEPGSTLHQYSEGAAARFVEKRRERMANKEQRNTRTLQFLCTQQAGGPNRFRERVNHVREVVKKYDSEEEVEGTGGARGGSPVLSQLSAVESDILRSMSAYNTRSLSPTQLEKYRAERERLAAQQAEQRAATTGDVPTAKRTVRKKTPAGGSGSRGTLSKSLPTLPPIKPESTTAAGPPKSSPAKARRGKANSAMRKSEDSYDDEFGESPGKPPTGKSCMVTQMNPATTTVNRGKEIEDQYEDDEVFESEVTPAAASSKAPEEGSTAGGDDYADDFSSTGAMSPGKTGTTESAVKEGGPGGGLEAGNSSVLEYDEGDFEESSSTPAAPEQTAPVRQASGFGEPVDDEEPLEEMPEDSPEKADKGKGGGAYEEDFDS